jgi:transposase-like protein
MPDKQRSARRQFTPEFKRDAVDLVRTFGPADRRDRPRAWHLRLHARQLGAPRRHRPWRA